MTRPLLELLQGAGGGQHGSDRPLCSVIVAQHRRGRGVREEVLNEDLSLTATPIFQQHADPVEAEYLPGVTIVV